MVGGWGRTLLLCPPQVAFDPVSLPPPQGRTRSSDAQRRVLDAATRQRRQKRQLEALEKDNFQDDPHAAFAHLTAKAKLPAFTDGQDSELGSPLSLCAIFTVFFFHICRMLAESSNPTLTVVLLGYLCLENFFTLYITDKKRKKTRSNADHFKQVLKKHFCCQVCKPNLFCHFLMQRFRKTFQTLIEELVCLCMYMSLTSPAVFTLTLFFHLILKPPEAYNQPSYVTAVAPPSKYPPRHFCAVCGFPSNYTCVTCGARYCCVKCLGTHQDTRSGCSTVLIRG